MANSTRRGGSSEFLYFGDGFLRDHVGQILDDPAIAIQELVANSYDAGADEVEVVWPGQPGELLSVTDNGLGMTREQFQTRWRTLSYDRLAAQGPDVEFPPDAKKRKRTAFGHNGKGRFSPFCFAERYEVETWRGGRYVKAVVELKTDGTMPFSCPIVSEGDRDGHGTKISVRPRSIPLASELIRDLIGSKFAVDPSFRVTVNGQMVKLHQLTSLSTRDILVPGWGTVRLHRIDPHAQERTLNLKGIAWWVNRRMVGTFLGWPGR